MLPLPDTVGCQKEGKMKRFVKQNLNIKIFREDKKYFSSYVYLWWNTMYGRFHVPFDSLCFSSLDRKAGFSNTCLSCNTHNTLGTILWYHIQGFFCEEITTLTREKRMLYLFFTYLMFKLEKQNCEVRYAAAGDRG